MRKALVGLALAGMAVAPLRAERIEFTNFDQNHSTIGFTVPILGGMSQVEGKFTAFSVALVYDEQDVTKSTVTAVIQAASIDTGIADRDEDLRSPRFFDAAAHPEIRFTSTRVGKQGDHLVVAGTLDLKGVKQEVTLDCDLKGVHTDAKSGKVLIGLAASTALDRRTYGISWEHPVDGFVGDQIGIEIHLISKLTARPAAEAPPHPGR